MTTVSERLADYVLSTRFEDLPSEVVEKAKDLLVYHLALAFAGTFTDRGRRAVALAYELSAGGGSSTIVGQRRSATMPDAVFAHAELIDINRDSRHLRSKTSPDRVADPVAWVLGEREHTSGRELITALVVGYDATCKLGEPQLHNGDYSRVPHKCAFAPFAVAAVAARLLRLDRERTARAIARAAHFGTGLNAGLGESFTFSAIARNGLMAALVPDSQRTEILHAIEGPQGMYAAFYGGPPVGLEASLATLGRDFSILQSTTLSHRGSLTHVAALEQMQGLIQKAQPRVQEIQDIVVTLPDEFRGRFAHSEGSLDRATTELDRVGAVIGSLRVRLAVLLVQRLIVPEPTLDQFADARVQEVFRKVRLAFEPLPLEHARVEVAMKDGRTLRSEGTFALRPRGDWSAWLRKDGERLLSDGRLRDLEQRVTHLEDVEDVGEVLACTVPDRQRSLVAESLPGS